MPAADLLDTLAGRDVRLSLEAGQIVIDAPAGALTPALRQQIAAHKTELIALLTALKPAISDVEVVPVGGLPLWLYDRLYPPGPGEPPAIPPPADLTKAEIAEAVTQARKQWLSAVQHWRMHPPKARR